MKFKSIVFVALTVFSTTIQGLMVDLYVHKDKFGQNLQVEVKDKCINVPRPWANLTQSIDTHGSCMQFYDEKSCKGRIAVIQPFHTVHQMDLSLISFENVIQSISPCGPKVQSGRYVIQSAVDASILSVHKSEGQFANVNTLPARPFIPKAQQWDIEEKEPNEYDIMPRIHEENHPVTYDTDAMKKGSFIRKRWKIESVGRGRYVIRSEWTQKCLYKTRLRRVEEHDCRAWSPNQEWVLRPLLTRPKPEEQREPELADGINFQIPSKIVDQHLATKKKQKEKEDKRKKKQAVKNNSAYLEPYRIRKIKKPTYGSSRPSYSEEEDVEIHVSKSKPPPKPEVLYANHGLPSFGTKNARLPPKRKLSFVNGAYPVFQEQKIEDPIFPDFLLDDDVKRPVKIMKKAKQPEPYIAPRYKVTRKPLTMPYPNLPHVVNSIPQHQGRDGNPLLKRRKPIIVRSKPKPLHDDSDEEEEEEDEEPESVEEKSKDYEQEVDNDDPTQDVASFLKLLFKGISTKMSTETDQKGEQEIASMFE